MPAHTAAAALAEDQVGLLPAGLHRTNPAPSQENKLRVQRRTRGDGLQRGLLMLLEQREPRSFDGGRGTQAYLRVFDSLFRVSVALCKLHGLYTHPHDCHRWYRRDVPAAALLALQVMSAQLEHEIRIPVRYRPPKTTPRELAPVVPLRPVPVVSVVDADELAPASVRRLLNKGMA